MGYSRLASYRVVTVTPGYTSCRVGRFQQGKWLQWVTATASYRVVTVGYSRYSKVPSGYCTSDYSRLHQVTAVTELFGNRLLPVTSCNRIPLLPTLPSGYVQVGLQQVTARCYQVTALSPRGYSALQQVTARYRVVTVGYSRLQHVTEWLQWVTAKYRVVTVCYRRLQQVTEWLQWVRAGYSRLPSGYSGLQQVTEWLQWVTTGYSSLPSGYSGLQQVTAGYRDVTLGYSRLPSGYCGLQQVTAGYRLVNVG